MASAKMASAIDVRIDDVGSILKFPIGFSVGENSAGFCQSVSQRVASGVDAEFPYRVCIVDRGLIAATLFAVTISDSQIKGSRPDLHRILSRTCRIGANPEKSDLVNFWGPDRRKLSGFCALLFFPTRCSQIGDAPEQFKSRYV